jgi:Glutaredoxin-like domain (DUF836)
MRDLVRAVLDEGFAAMLQEVDLREDPELELRYLLEIPVLLLGAREIARHRTSADELRRRLRDAGVDRTEPRRG